MFFRQLRNNANVGGAYIEARRGAVPLARNPGFVQSADDISNIVVKTGRKILSTFATSVRS